MAQRILKTLQPYSAVQRFFHGSRKSYGVAQATDRQPFIDSLYSENDRKQLLHVFNKWTSEELQRIKGLTKKRIECLDKYRADHGSHATLANVSQVSGITVLALEKICKSILSGTVTKKTSPDVAPPPAMLYYPVIPTVLRQTAENIVSISVSGDSVFWSQLATSSRLMDWNYQPLWGRDAKPPRLDYMVYIEAISRAVGRLPKSTIYVTEAGLPTYFRGGCTQSMLMTNIVGAITTALLYGRLNVGSEPHIFTLPSRNVTRHFNLIVGGERVSGQSITHNLIYNGHHEKIAVEVPAFLRESYVQQDDSTKEFLSNCLLQAVTFMELVVKPLADSASLTNKSTACTPAVVRSLGAV